MLQVVQWVLTRGNSSSSRSRSSSCPVPSVLANHGTCNPAGCVATTLPPSLQPSQQSSLQPSGTIASPPRHRSQWPPPLLVWPTGPADAPPSPLQPIRASTCVHVCLPSYHHHMAPMCVDVCTCVHPTCGRSVQLTPHPHGWLLVCRRMAWLMISQDGTTQTVQMDKRQLCQVGLVGRV